MKAERGMRSRRFVHAQGYAGSWAQAAVALMLSLFGLASAASAGKWDKLENCRLLSEEYMDGDSFHVQHGLKDYIFRLYFVDAPETDATLKDRIADQAGYFGISKTQVKQYGRRARLFTEEQLRGGFTVYTQWQDAQGDSGQQRFYAVVKIGSDDLASLLVEEGLARVYGASADLPDGRNINTVFDQLRQLETRAKQKKRGAWGARGEQVEEEEPEEDAGWSADAGPGAPSVAGVTSTNGVTEEDFAAAETPQWPNVPMVAFLRAEAFINLERFEEAERELRRLRKRFPKHELKPQIEFYIALSVVMQERFKEARPLFEELLKRYPDGPIHAEAEYWLPVALFYDGQYDQALPRFEAYAKKYPLAVYAPEAEYRAALCRYSLEDFKGCALALGGWLERHPEHYFRWEAQLIRADALAAMGELEQAKNNYLRVTKEAGPFYYLALTQLAKVYKALATEQDFRDMAAAFARYIQECPDSGNIVDAAWQAGWALRQANRPEEARRLYWVILSRHGNNPKWEGFDVLLKDLQTLYRDQPAGARERDFQTALDAALREKQATLAGRLALARLSAAEPTNRLAAADAFAAQYRIETLGPEGRAFLGDLYSRAGQPGKARPYLERLLADTPESRFAPLAHTRLAEQALAAGDFTNALAHADTALAGAGEPGVLMEAALARARGLQAQGRHAEAIEMYNYVLANRAAARAMKPEALLGIAACLEAQGKHREAIPYYQRIYVLYQAYTDAVAQAYLKSGAAFERINNPRAAANTYREMLEMETMAGRPEAAQARERLAKLNKTES